MEPQLSATCQKIANELNGLKEDKQQLATDLSTASPSEKPALIKKLNALNNQIDARKEALEACIKQHPAILVPFTEHIIYHWGEMHLTDHETFGDNEVAIFEWGPYVVGVQAQENDSATSSVTSPLVGDELYGKLQLTCTTRADGKVYVFIKALLMEGSLGVVTDADLNGQRTFGPYTMAPDETKRLRFRVDNTDDGGDYIDFDVWIYIEEPRSL